MFVYPSAQPPQPALVHTRVVSMEGSTYGAEKSVGLGVAEIILRVICMVSRRVLCVHGEIRFCRRDSESLELLNSLIPRFLFTKLGKLYYSVRKVIYSIRRNTKYYKNIYKS